MRERMVVIGGDAAGMSAAAQARRRRDPDALDIVVFERGEHTSYSACGIPYLIGEVVPDPDQLVARSPEEHRRRGLDVRTGHEVVAVDLDDRSVTAHPVGGGRAVVVPFDHLLIATGAVPRHPDLAGADSDGIHGIQTLEDGIALDAHLTEHPEHRRAVVVGGGYIGLEMAEAMTRRGLAVTLLDQAPEPMNTLDPAMGRLVADALRDIGVDVRTGESVEAFEVEGGRVHGVVTSTGTFPADVVVLGLGVRPASDLAREAGIGIGPTGGIATDARMATDVPGVWAAGDCAEIQHRVTGRPVTIALGTHANKQGRVVGVNVTGGSLTFPGVVGTAVTKVCQYEVARTGLSEREAREAGVASVSATIESSTRAGYFPGVSTVTVKMVAEAGTGRLLGAQIIGEEGAAKRIDVVATALWNEMTVRELVQVDLGYAPPFSPVWDPVLVAARRVERELDG